MLLEYVLSSKNGPYTYLGRKEEGGKRMKKGKDGVGRWKKGKEKKKKGIHLTKALFFGLL